MPLYVGDYLGDTGHLSTSQHGAYLLLMMHYWRQGGLPDDDKQLAAITKLPLRIWIDTRETIQSFFYDGWQHKRIEGELYKMETATGKRAAAGSKGGTQATINRWRHKAEAAMLKQTSSNTTATLNHSHSPSKKEEEGLAKGKGEKPPLAVSSELAAIMARKQTGKVQ